MMAEGAIDFEALEAQAASLMGLFVEAGYERVAPAFIQPASLFLDRIGETLRARTYVFTDPNGEELCLRPDLTLPVCRIFLEREGGSAVSKFCYNGPAFRVQEGRPDPLRPREFRQAGIEYFGSAEQAADLEVVALTLTALRSAGLKSFVVRLGHIGMFSALLDALAMPSRWRERLRRAFWRPQVFAAELNKLSASQEAARASPVVLPAELTEQALLDELDARGVPFIGLRRPSEVLKRLKDKAADASEPPLAKETVGVIEQYLRIRGEALEALKAMDALFRRAGLDLNPLLVETGILFSELKRLADGAPVLFDAGFGRHFEYYTGMVFQIEVEGAGVRGHIAGGGRYDGIIAALSSGHRNAPAVGAAIHTERLLAAVRR
jgi:ATP phosphoribosyltransferase regulatory subunit